MDIDDVRTRGDNLYYHTYMVPYIQLAPIVSSGSSQIRSAMSKQFLQKYSDTVSINMLSA